MEKIWHADFIEYMNIIVNHQNYKGLPIAKKYNGSYTWIAPAKSIIGAKRKEWANKKLALYGIDKNDNSPYSKLMFAIHPTKMKPCQICGKQMSLYYIYLNSSFIKAIKKEFNYDATTTQSIYDICNILIQKNFNKDKIKDFFIKNFNLNLTIKDSLKTILSACELNCRNGNCKKLGPGAMSNFPDRFDGFHTYNRCCRAIEDKGRSKENLRTYGKDRRAYEYWSNGNIHAANLFMHSDYFNGTSADHVGPISLGFVHDSNYLRPLSSGENSAKRDKLSFEDIEQLIEIEENTSIKAISWFSKILWDYIKNNYKNNSSQIPIYRDLLKQNMSNFMYVLWYILNNTGSKGEDFLVNNLLYRNFKYFNYNYTFDNTGKILSRTLRNHTDNNKDEIDRYIRIALESVYDYNSKDNRNLKNTLDKQDIIQLNKICNLINLKEENYIIYQKFKKLIEQIQIKLLKANI